MFSSCFGSRRRSDEEEPLLAQYDDDTSLQRQLHQKLHTYQMLRALSQGFMPSNEQTIVNLRTLVGSAFLNPDNAQLSDSGRALIHYTKQWIKQFIQLLEHKNSKDQIQDFMWYLSKARVSIDMEDIAERASTAKAKADTAAVYTSLQTVGSLLLTNSDFRLFLADLNVVSREVFKDTAFALSAASKDAAKRLEPSKEDQAALKQPGADGDTKPSQQDLEQQVGEVSDVLKGSASTVLEEAESSIVSKLQGDEKDTMLHRLKEAVLKLRQRRDYTDSVSTLSLLFKRYAMVYSRIARDTLETAEDDIDRNPETDRALHNFWIFIKSFGDTKQWDELETSFKELTEHGREDPEFEKLVSELGRAAQEMFTDPSFFDHAEQRFQDLRDQSRQLTTRSSLRDDVDALLVKVQSTFKSVLADKDISNLIKTSTIIAKILSPAHHYTNTDLVTDSVNVFVPLLIQAINYVPIPRLELSTPQIDLLLENLILEPGATINNSSFFPYKLRIETLNDIEIRKARFRTTSAVNTLVRLTISGLSIRAEEIGFWMRAHSGLLRLADEGIASFELDERGLDIQIDVEVGKDRLDKIVSLKGVRVHIHKLNWKLRKSKFSLLAWLFKPFLRPIIRNVMEMQIASAIGESLQFANRELLYARERLRATRIADPDDLKTFFKAVLARLVPPEDPDLYARVGVVGKGPFEGVYAPGSVVKLWNEEATQATQRIRENERDGWRNTVFDVHATMLT
ncbi:bactericidal permeability-increasing protein [Apodospora peruviana]|uniref:Bactericidal permeability-increasing protein n=1 Tax=Apodospora peruviana TaxID=516989 RepID=A0AAE0MAM5_9PEZI|nr:bactericidal permeability-increasing protein [Apodospora peruviana]